MAKLSLLSVPFQLGAFCLIGSITDCFATTGGPSHQESKSSISTSSIVTFWDPVLNNWPSDLTSNYNTDTPKILDFLPLENPHVISGQANLDSIHVSNDPNSQVLANLFNSGEDEVEVKTWNGAWTDYVDLPDASTIPNLSEFQLSCSSTWSVNVRYIQNPGDINSEQIKNVSNGNYLILAVVDGMWITEDEYESTTSPSSSPSTVLSSDLLKGTVLFAQHQIMPSKHGIQGDHQPHLTSYRNTLVMLRPHNLEEDDVEINMSVRNGDGMIISDIAMDDPSHMPMHVGYINLSTDINNIVFPPSLSDPYVVQYQSNLDAISNDEDGQVLTNLLINENTNVEIKTWDGSWVGTIYLPQGDNLPEDSKIQLTCNSGYNVKIYYPNTEEEGTWRVKSVSKGQVIVFMLVEKMWLCEDDLKHNEYTFGNGFYTAILEKEWVQPGITLEFSAESTSVNIENKYGVLDSINVGGTTELMLTTIDVGMLTPPRNNFRFRDDITAHREYYETAPLSRLIVVQYETMHFEEIMLPSGKLYTDVSDDNGGWHSGDMRQHIGKVLISHGIDMANYGIHSSKGNSESSHPFTCALLTAHNTVGLYQNGRIVHGGSGGNGMVTLDNSLGNEFSHEVGHNYGLGHYVGGFDGSVHRPSDEINSSWGWDSKENVFLPNFDPSDTGNDSCVNDECQTAFMNKFRFGTDSMAGGYPMWSGANRFTMYTPFVSKKIQTFLENKAVWDPTSTTGFRKFNENSKKMEEYVNNDNGGKVPRLYRVPVTTLVGYYDPSPTRGLPDYVYPALHGAYGFVYDDDSGDNDNTSNGCHLEVKTNVGNDQIYSLTSTVYDTSSMNKFHVNIATQYEPYEASIYCNGQLRTSRVLENPEPNQPLTYTVNGIPFSEDSISPSTTLSALPTDEPSLSPSKMSLQTDEPSLSPSEMLLQTNKPSLSPSKMLLQTNEPSLSPSKMLLQTNEPSLSPSKTLSTLPTGENICAKSNEQYLSIQVQVDSHATADKNRYNLKMQKPNGKWKRLDKKRFSDDMFYTFEGCFKTNKCYKFIISDKKKDGICCEHGEGYYSIDFNGNIISNSFTKGRNRVEYFGNCATGTQKIDDTDVDANIVNIVDDEKYIDTHEVDSSDEGDDAVIGNNILGEFTDLMMTLLQSIFSPLLKNFFKW